MMGHKENFGLLENKLQKFLSPKVIKIFEILC
jgi:hypothetical protein